MPVCFLFSTIMVSHTRTIQLCTACIINLSSQQQGNIFSSKKRRPVTRTSTNHCESWQSQQHQHPSHGQHAPKIAKLIHYFHTRNNKLNKQTRLTALKFRLTWVSWHQKCTICTQLLASLSLLLSLQFPLTILLSLLRSIASLGFLYKSFTPLATSSFHVFLGLPLCLAPSITEINTISPNDCHPFLKHDHIIAIYFFGPLLLCLLFPANALIQCKIVYP